MTWATAFDTNWISKFPSSPQAMKQRWFFQRNTTVGRKKIRQKPSTSGFTEATTSRSSRPSLLKIYGIFFSESDADFIFPTWRQHPHAFEKHSTTRIGSWWMRMHLARPKPQTPLWKTRCVVSAGDPSVWLDPVFFWTFQNSKAIATSKTLHPTAQKLKTLSIWKPKIPARLRIASVFINPLVTSIQDW